MLTSGEPPAACSSADRTSQWNCTGVKTSNLANVRHKTSEVRAENRPSTDSKTGLQGKPQGKNGASG